MNQSSQPLRIVSPMVLMCIGFSMVFFGMAVAFLFASIDSRFEGNAMGPVGACISSAGAIVATVGASIAIARFASARMSVAGSILLVIAAFLGIVGYFLCVGAFCEGLGGDDDLRIVNLITVIIEGGLMLTGIMMLQRTIPALKVVTVGWWIALVALLGLCIAIFIIDPDYYYHYNSYYSNSGVYHRDDVVVAGIVFGIIVLGGCIVQLTGWLKAIKEARGNAHSGYGSASETIAAANANESIRLQLQQWAAGLTLDQIKYVIQNPAGYNAEAIDACVKEMANRL